MRKTFTAFALLITSVMGANASVNTDAAATNYTESQWEHYAAAEYAGGTGTKDDPYLIATAEQLMKLAVEIENLAEDDSNWEGEYSAGKYWKQTADIVLNENVIGCVTWASDDASGITDANLRSFKGIGYVTSDVDFQVFAGTYDGDGHSISGMFTKTGKNKSTGIFNNIRGATVKNLIVKDSYLSENANVGLVVGTAEKGSLVINCQTSGIIYCGGSYHAGIVGYANGSKVLNCVSDAWLWAKNNTGGIIGKMGNTAYAANCFYSGWLGAVVSNTAKYKYWGAVCPEIGSTETTVTTADPENPDKTITVCENPSRAENCFYMDTCTVRHFPDSKIIAYNADNSKYGVVENCVAIGVDKVADAVSALNNNAKEIESACSWELNAAGQPVLTFKAATTNISGLNAEVVAKSNVMYNLAGQRVDNSYKGMVIQNGKKFMNK